MARQRFRAVPPAIQVLANTPKTVLQLVAPTNIRVALKGWSISFNGISPSAIPVTLDLLRQTTAGTMTTTVGIVKEDDGTNETLQSSMRYDASAEPTSGDILDSQYIHPQTGVEYPLALDEEIIISGGGRIGLRVTIPAGQSSVYCFPKFKAEE